MSRKKDIYLMMDSNQFYIDLVIVNSQPEKDIILFHIGIDIQVVLVDVELILYNPKYDLELDII